jgi:hypothetical protein
VNCPRTLYGPRVRKPLVWCAAWVACRAVGTPGYTGDGEPELCESCEVKRLAHVSEKPVPIPEPEAVT